MTLIRLFGGASLERDGAILSGPAAQRHRLALLSLLCVSHPRPMSRDKLLGYLWPERDTAHARNLLKQAVHVLRRTLGEEAVVSAGDELRLGSPPLECDLLSFGEAVEAGDWERASGIYSGPFLDGFFLSDAPEFEHWVDQVRERLRREWRQALATLAEQQLTSGDTDVACQSWQHLLADDPHDARATIALMETLEQMGDRAGAIRQARLHEILLERDFGAGPDAAVRAAADRIRAGDGVKDATPPEPEAHLGGAITEAPPPPHGEPAGGIREQRQPALPQAAWRWKRTTGIVTALLLLGTLAWISTRALSDQRDAITRIAVLPLANLTGDPAQDYFVAGMHDALISELAQVEALTVLSRQSVLRYEDSDVPLPAIAEALHVDAIVEGAVFKSGDSVRISVQVIQANPERHLIAETFTGPLDRALPLQGEVAHVVAEAMRAQVSPAVRERLVHQRTVDPAAQDAYLSGLYHLEHAAYGQGLPGPEWRAETRQAIAKLQEAVALDPTWAAAHAKLALSYHWLASAFGEESDLYFRKSKASALRALALDSTEAQAWASLGFVLFLHEWDWTGAEQAIRRAIELEPNAHHWIYALYLREAGRHEESIAEYRKAEARDPLSDHLKAQVANEYACAGRHDEAVAEARKLTARVAASGRSGVVGDSTWLLAFLVRENSFAGRHAEAIAAGQQLLARTDTLYAGPALAFALAMGGRSGEARSLVAWMEEKGWSSGLVGEPAVYAALGDTARAVSATITALREEKDLATVRCWTVFRMLPDNPKLEELLRPVHFPN